jgi:hypothetical protein
MDRSTRAIAVAIAGAVSVVYAAGAVAQVSPDQQRGDAPGNQTPPAASAGSSSPPPAVPGAPAESTLRPPPAPPPSDTTTTAPVGGPAETATPAAPEVPPWLKGVTLGAGAILWYYQPIVPRATGVENNVSVFWAHLLVDGKWGIFGFHLEPRFRDTPLRTITTTVNGATVVTYAQDDHAYLQEAYASVDLDAIGAHLKLGKEYSHLGYFWDNSFYGNVQVYDGLKLDPDYGASLEGDVGKAKDSVSLGWWAQYFVVDGTTNVSLPGRDTISVPGARRRNQTVVRLEPRFKAGPASVLLGASGEYLQADIPSIGPQNVWRGALDATVTIGGLKVLAEVQHQDGRHVTDFPFPSTANGPGSSNNIEYLQVGGDYSLGPVTARYYVSMGSYNNAPVPTGGTATVKQWLHVPALAYAVSPNISLLGELVFWQHDTPTSSTLYDRSFNVTLYAHL